MNLSSTQTSGMFPNRFLHSIDQLLVVLSLLLESDVLLRMGMHTTELIVVHQCVGPRNLLEHHDSRLFDVCYFYGLQG